MPIERTGKVTGWRATGGNTHPFPAVKTWRASEGAGARNRGAAVPRCRFRVWRLAASQVKNLLTWPQSSPKAATRVDNSMSNRA